ncbi:PIK1 [[Candida] subhashii]|uniref:1-phosphatidylinositol 4-kinase n=1 Tax=[Candida] subhashii TaxID=561895 RepID=A0A8J5UJ36_9ASCO|nr:PIK1 [[Candida] subhashii]KAG7661517.1 PIK1 [[Candida] subhashii]
MFNTDKIIQTSEFRENLQPALVLCGAIASSIAAPSFNDHVLPLVKSQAKQQKSFVFKLANFQKSLTKNLTLKNQRASTEASSPHSDDETSVSAGTPKHRHRSASLPKSISKMNSMSLSSDESADDYSERGMSFELEKELNRLEMSNEKLSSSNLSEIEETLRINTIIKSKKRIISASNQKPSIVRDLFKSNDPYNINYHSLPDLSSPTETELKPYIFPAESESSLVISRTTSATGLRRQSSQKSNDASVSTYNNLSKRLYVNYTKKETAFIMALQNISVRLSQVPKEARLSALRAELSIINDSSLPSEVDIPQLLPITSNRNKKYHKILKLNINEACVLNSAERVPFLLLVEYLSDEIDFNPLTEYNQRILDNTSNNQIPTRIGEITRENESADFLASQSSIFRSETMSTPVPDETDLSELPMNSSSPKPSNDLFKTDSLFTEESRILRESSPGISETSTKALANQMRIASVMLQQLQNAGKPDCEQSRAIKDRIVQSMISLQDQFDDIDFQKLNELQGDVPNAGERKLENDFKLGEDWNTKKNRIRNSSIYGHLPNWDLCSVIAKNGDDLPQEAFACQLITMISNIWKKDAVGAWTKRMKILITSANTGLVETITNAMSIHSIKKSLTDISIKNGENEKGRIFTLSDYYNKVFGDSTAKPFKQAQDNFSRSLASYSIICYVLQIKDRHNGNIMVDSEGHIIHIDFGFLLSNSPGSVGFEAAPFKLTSEYVELLGGLDSPVYLKFVDLCKKCFLSLRRNSNQIIDIVELMQKDSSLPCFNNGENTSVLLQQRLQLQLSEEEAEQYVETFLIGKSIGSMYTRLYDQFQMITQGIYS